MDQLVTKDGVRIAYSFEGDGPVVLLLHMLNSNRTSWDGFALRLRAAGFSTMSIDFRGHGESDLSWTTFSAFDFQKMELDIVAVQGFLQKQNASLVAVVGASIGANHALRFAAKNPSVRAVVLLSPGLDYRGVTTQDVIKYVSQPVLVVASKGDAYSAQSSQALHQRHGVLRLLDGDAHGTRMLDDAFMSDIISWLKENTKED